MRNTSDPKKGFITKKDILSVVDWKTLKIQRKLLQPFYTLTIRLEDKNQLNSYGSVWEVLPTIEVLLGGLKKAKDIYDIKKHKHVAELINIDWKKLREYYTKLNYLSAYAVAVDLNPSIKLRYFETK